MKQQNFIVFSAAAIVVMLYIYHFLANFNWNSVATSVSASFCSGRSDDEIQFETMPNYGFRTHLLK